MDDQGQNQLVSDLRNGDAEHRRAALRALLKRDSIDGAIAASLTSLLVDGDGSVRALAAEVLSQHALHQDLTVGRDDKKFSRAFSEQSRFVQGEDSVFWDLGDPDPDERAAAAEILRQRGDAEVADTFIKAMEGSPGTADRLIRLRDPRVLPSLAHAHIYGALPSATRCLVAVGYLDVDYLLDLLEHGEAIVRVGISYILGQMGLEQAIDPLLNLYHSDSHPVVRGSVLDALGAFYSSEVIEVLLTALDSAEAELQASAARSLGRLGEPMAIDRLIGLLSSDDDVVKEGAAQALGDMKNDRAIEPLIVTIHNETGAVQEAACGAVGKITGTAAGELLVQLFRGMVEPVERLAELGENYLVDPLTWSLREGGPKVRAACARALARFKSPETVQPLVDALPDASGEVAEAAAASLSSIGEAAIEPLVALVSHPDAGVRCLMVEALGRIGSREGIPAIVDCLEDYSARVRAVSLEAAAKIGEPSVAPAVIRLLEDPKPQIVASALSCLSKLRCAEAREALLSALNSPDTGVRLAAIEGLGELGDAAAVPALKEFASFFNRKETHLVKDAARDALERLGAH
ncbi:MAG: hypothetical protein AUJ92_01755 [Armatimonadetes bacterium CG2_30_59_28]|nr:hypothetical protein [Armatimonadota bacterium]OIO98231.1 MAG: hypothetical protein AUJ92_01755 [Armatimonadetes bacterium CG2_30_59_28]PIU65623.1 MAG: hypothetical protein COS85_07955 [Armatimonadetes bacterium CG07_land_8_20_14_0_80_59_28]PIX45757.1 MAG: hypothetical protein COZ56_01145 [Armatimonadetes bacterium CG_4_8_14_3_um_filter_58_9]PIY48010.1 MAG: hypothetical protein COZ05_04405 [Armatimonadetes bacterium CG_4_10_14_3_um_filter_59_10]